MSIHSPKWYFSIFSSGRSGRGCRLTRFRCFFIQFLPWKRFDTMKTEPKRHRGWIVIGNTCTRPWTFILTSIDGLKLWKDIRPFTAPGWGSPSIITALHVQGQQSPLSIKRKENFEQQKRVNWYESFGSYDRGSLPLHSYHQNLVHITRF